MRFKLSDIRDKYGDFSHIDSTKSTLERYENWSVKIMQVTGDVSSIFESFFNCGICNSLAVQATVVETCNHVFCKKCLEVVKERSVRNDDKMV